MKSRKILSYSQIELHWYYNIILWFAFVNVSACIFIALYSIYIVQNIECRTNIPLCYTEVLSWNTIARMATITFIVQTIINFCEISFSNYAPPLVYLPYLHFAVKSDEEGASESGYRLAKLSRRGGRKKKLTVRPTISARYFDQVKISRKIILPIVLCAISKSSLGRSSPFDHWKHATFGETVKAAWHSYKTVRRKISSIENNKLLFQTISMKVSKMDFLHDCNNSMATISSQKDIYTQRSIKISDMI